MKINIEYLNIMAALHVRVALPWRGLVLLWTTKEEERCWKRNKTPTLFIGGTCGAGDARHANEELLSTTKLLAGRKAPCAQLLNHLGRDFERTNFVSGTAEQFHTIALYFFPREGIGLRG